MQHALYSIEFSDQFVVRTMRCSVLSNLTVLTWAEPAHRRHWRSFCFAWGSNRKRLYRKMTMLSSCDRCCCCSCSAGWLLAAAAAAADVAWRPGGVNSTLNLPVVPNLPYKQDNMQ